MKGDKEMGDGEMGDSEREQIGILHPKENNFTKRTPRFRGVFFIG